MGIENTGLYLDGAAFLAVAVMRPKTEKIDEINGGFATLEKHGGDSENNLLSTDDGLNQPSMASCRDKWLASDGWIRLTIPFHFAVEWIAIIGFQFIRGTSSILAGVFTLSGKKIVTGLKDYISLLIQAVALPIIAIPATISPKAGLRLLSNMRKLCNDNRIIDDECEVAIREKCSDSRYVRVVDNFFRGIAAVPNSMILIATKGVHSLLRGEIEKTRITASLFVVVPLFSLVSVVFGGWGARHDKPLNEEGFMASLSHASHDMYHRVHCLNGIEKVPQN